MTSSHLHGLSKKEIFKKALVLKDQGKLYDLNNSYHEETFRGSIDRFCEIAYGLRCHRKVLDVGSGGGLLLSLLSELGHECYGIDINDVLQYSPEIYVSKNIVFKICNIEIDHIPHPDNYFDAVVCCQTLEHFSHSHMGAVKEMRRVLKTGGILEIDVPNAVCFRNRSRMMRGKHITWEYKKHYLYATPVQYKGMSFYPDRHNREFTIDEIKILLEEANFTVKRMYFLKSRRYREGAKSILSIGSMMRDLVPSWRKSIIAFGEKSG
jgi:ubiquinone/menaquinone biosynthesis C-methylase UbiE